ncbi:hypothetical protein AAFA46_08430 [Oscillospiraceae bacterium WX1]
MMENTQKLSPQQEDALINVVVSRYSELLNYGKAGTLSAKESLEFIKMSEMLKIDINSGQMTDTSQLSPEDHRLLGRYHAKLAQAEHAGRDAETRNRMDLAGDCSISHPATGQTMTPAERHELGRQHARQGK